MKTTVEIADDLFEAAKKRAAELREPLRALIERGLRAESPRPGLRLRDPLARIPWLMPKFR